jgi:hypothetical protein
MNARVLAKLTSVTAVSLLALIAVLCLLTVRDGAAWKETFAATLAALLGYYIGRNRTTDEKGDAPK